MVTATSIQVFLSYRRQDNDAYNGVVQRLAMVLQHRFYAETGVQLDAFIDLDMRGGERWHKRLQNEIQQSHVFIPIITMAYFQSEYCVEELTWFLDKTPSGKRSTTVLPVVLAGMTLITRDHANPKVREVAELNCRNAQQAIRGGYQTEAWETLIDQLLGDLISVWSTAADGTPAVASDPQTPSVVETQPTGRSSMLREGTSARKTPSAGASVTANAPVERVTTSTPVGTPLWSSFSGVPPVTRARKRPPEASFLVKRSALVDVFAALLQEFQVWGANTIDGTFVQVARSGPGPKGEYQCEVSTPSSPEQEDQLKARGWYRSREYGGILGQRRDEDTHIVEVAKLLASVLVEVNGFSDAEIIEFFPEKEELHPFLAARLTRAGQLRPPTPTVTPESLVNVRLVKQGTRREAVVLAIQRGTGLDPHTAARLANNVSSIIRRDIPLSEATSLCAALEAAGATASIEPALPGP